VIVDLVLRPHIERAGGHTERFDALLDDQVICTSRSGWHDPARALLALGYPPETLLRVHHQSKPIDPTVVPRPVGELAKWTYAARGALRCPQDGQDGVKERVGPEDGHDASDEGVAAADPDRMEAA
jgi:hypothetical protein